MDVILIFRIIGNLGCIIGLFFIISSLIGLFKFECSYNKMHVIAVGDCCGSIILLASLGFLQDNLFFAMKYFLVAILIMFISPISTHILANMLWKCGYNFSNNSQDNSSEEFEGKNE